MNMVLEQGILVLKPREERRWEKGHFWIFSNEIESKEGLPQTGDLVRVYTSKGISLGLGFYNDQSLIAVRMLPQTNLTSVHQYVLESILTADEKRKRLGFDNVYRMVHGESDFIPGLVVDRYGDLFVVESFTAGIDRLLDSVVDILYSEFKAKTIVEKSDSRWRNVEGLKVQKRLLLGEWEEVIVQVKGISYKINYLDSQKTGLFLDQSSNRALIEKLTFQQTVLDCFCCDGGFGLHAIKGGALSVVGVDSSETAIERASVNAQLNNYDHRIQFIQADVFTFLHEAANEGKTWDIIVLDPPAFVRTKKTLATGLKGYRKLNEAGMHVLRPGGMLVTCSCSHHVHQEEFLRMLQRAAARKQRRLQVFQITGASPDHPFLPGMPETTYLKCVFAFVL